MPNEKIVQNSANEKPYYFALESTYSSCGCFILAFYDQKFLVGVKFDRFLHPEIIFRGVKVECKSFQEKLK